VHSLQMTTLKLMALTATNALMSLPVILSLFALSILGAMLSVFLGWKIAIASIALSGCAVGLVGANLATSLMTVGSLLCRISTQLCELYEQESTKPESKKASVAALKETLTGKPN
jgi:hypothetical protein